MVVIRVSALFPARAEETAEQLAALVLQHSGQDFGAVVESGVVENREHRVAAPLGVGDAPNHEWHAGQNDRARAHGARFFGDVQDGVEQAPVAERSGCLGQGDHLGMGCGVLEQFGLIVCATQHADRGERLVERDRLADNDAAGRHLASLGGLERLAESLPHEIGVKIGSQHAADCRRESGGL